MRYFCHLFSSFSYIALQILYILLLCICVIYIKFFEGVRDFKLLRGLNRHKCVTYVAMPLSFDCNIDTYLLIRRVVAKATLRDLFSTCSFAPHVFARPRRILASRMEVRCEFIRMYLCTMHSDFKDLRLCNSAKFPSNCITTID